MEKSHNAFKEAMQKELDTVEARFSRVLHQNTMMGEDFRSQAATNMGKLLLLRAQHKALKAEYEESAKVIDEERQKQITLVQDKELAEMAAEEYRTRMVNQIDLVERL